MKKLILSLAFIATLLSLPAIVRGAEEPKPAAAAPAAPPAKAEPDDKQRLSDIEAYIAGRGLDVKETGWSSDRPEDPILRPSFTSINSAGKETYATRCRSSANLFRCHQPRARQPISGGCIGDGVDVTNGLISTLKTHFRPAFGVK